MSGILELPSVARSRKADSPSVSGSIVEQFGACAARVPGATAVMAGNDCLTYAELDFRSNQLARFLKKLGAGPGSFVGVHLDRTCDLVVALLGVLKAGAAYLPLDTEYPQARLKFMIDSARSGIIISQQSTSGAIEEPNSKLVLMDADWPAVSREAGTPLSNRPAPRSLAYLIYTSGSTGKPKGVMIEHRSLANFMRSMQRVLGLTNASVVAAMTSISFDISILEIFLPLSVGASVVMFPRASIRNPAELISEIKDRKVTLIQATPASWRVLLDAGLGSKKITALCGGEALRPSLAEQLIGRFKQVWNMYGPTEATIWSSMEPVEAGRTIFIGKPIENTRYYVLNENLNRVSLGDVGELYIAGEGVTRGYQGLPAVTADRLRPDAFKADGARMYRTGDLVRLHENDNIEFIGRADWQVKLRGHRIELEEIEAAILKHPSVKQAVVAILGATEEEKRLGAYVVTQPKGSLVLRELKEMLREALPEYMVPSEYIELESMPLTASGKVDRKAIADIKGVPVSRWSYVAPRDELESAVAQIWQDVLKTTELGVEDHFLDLGGHSLPAMRITAKINEKFGAGISMAMLFAEPTVALYAAALRQKISRNSNMQVSS